MRLHSFFIKSAIETESYGEQRQEKDKRLVRKKSPGLTSRT